MPELTSNSIPSDVSQSSNELTSSSRFDSVSQSTSISPTTQQPELTSSPNHNCVSQSPSELPSSSEPMNVSQSTSELPSSSKPYNVSQSTSKKTPTQQPKLPSSSILRCVSQSISDNVSQSTSVNIPTPLQQTKLPSSPIPSCVSQLTIELASSSKPDNVSQSAGLINPTNTPRAPQSELASNSMPNTVSQLACAPRQELPSNSMHNSVSQFSEHTDTKPINPTVSNSLVSKNIQRFSEWQETSTKITASSCNKKNKHIEKTWQELSRNKDDKLVMMRVHELGVIKSSRTRRRTTSKKTSYSGRMEAAIASPRQLSAASRKQEDYVKMTSPLRKVKTASNIGKVKTSRSLEFSPGGRNQTPRKPTPLHTRRRVETRKPDLSGLKFKTLLLNWEMMSTSNLTPAVPDQRTELVNFVDGQPQCVLENLEKKFGKKT